MAANPFPRRTFVIAGEAGQADRTINMIEIDDALKTAVLALLNAATILLTCLPADSRFTNRRDTKHQS